MIRMLEESDRLELLRLARQTLESYLSTGVMPQSQISNPALRLHNGAFVSLHRGEELRGCIGQLIADRELHLIIQDCAVSAATADRRFSPVTARELPHVQIEISILTPLRRIQDVEEIDVGRHGLYLVRGPNRGLLLPQVATHYNWNRETFLIQTCRKAGLPDSAWKDPATAIHIFEAQVFSEP